MIVLNELNRSLKPLIKVGTAADVVHFLATACARRGCKGVHSGIVCGGGRLQGGLRHRLAVAFEGVCTHMCDARRGSSYSRVQFGRVAAVVAQARSRGVFVPSVHFENSECLLCGLIPDQDVLDLLSGGKQQLQQQLQGAGSGGAAGGGGGRRLFTVGYCRTGGALYGQRSHDCLRPCVSLKAQVRHVHVVKAGVSVGYERSW